MARCCVCTDLNLVSLKLGTESTPMRWTFTVVANLSQRFSSRFFNSKWILHLVAMKFYILCFHNKYCTLYFPQCERPSLHSALIQSCCLYKLFLHGISCKERYFVWKRYKYKQLARCKKRVTELAKQPDHGCECLEVALLIK